VEPLEVLRQERLNELRAFVHVLGPDDAAVMDAAAAYCELDCGMDKHTAIVYVTTLNAVDAPWCWDA